MKFHRRRKVETLLNIAPLIDCVFLLLIFFLLASSFVEDAGLEIDLPESASALPLEETQVIVSLSVQGELAVNGRASGLRELQRDVGAAMERHAKKSVILRADREVRLGLFTRVMDKLKAAGAQKIDIQTTPSVGGEDDT